MPEPYTDEDLNAAVSQGIFAATQLDDFRAFVSAKRTPAQAEEESFRLITGFNDIFVTIPIVMVLVAVTVLSWSINPFFSFGSMLVTSWGLAEIFTRKRRMALPSIILALSWVGGWAAVGTTLGAAFVHASFTDDFTLRTSDAPISTLIFVAGLKTALVGCAAYAYWRRFKTPIIVAAGCVAPIMMIMREIIGQTGQTYLFLFLFVAGGVCFAWAVMWDARDPERRTYRSDVAFWLHMCAAPMLAHSIFKLLDLDADFFRTQTLPWISAVEMIALYAFFAMVGLLLNRRALMVSALGYFIYATKSMFTAVQSLKDESFLPILVVGGLLLVLSIYWHQTRAVLLKLTPHRWRRIFL